MITKELDDPRGLVDGVQRDGQPCLHYVALKDRCRVIPQTMADVMWLASLSHQNERHAPAFGDGVLVKKRCLDQYLYHS